MLQKAEVRFPRFLITRQVYPMLIRKVSNWLEICVTCSTSTVASTPQCSTRSAVQSSSACAWLMTLACSSSSAGSCMAHQPHGQVNRQLNLVPPPWRMRSIVSTRTLKRHCGCRKHHAGYMPVKGKQLGAAHTRKAFRTPGGR